MFKGENGLPGLTAVVSGASAGSNPTPSSDQRSPLADPPASDPEDPLPLVDRAGSLSDSQLQNCLQRRGRRNQKLKKYDVNGEPEFQLCDRTCRYCGVLRNSPADLRRHLRKHTGERPFACTVS